MSIRQRILNLPLCISALILAYNHGYSEDIAHFTNRALQTADGGANRNRLHVGTGEWTDFQSNIGSIDWEVKNYNTGVIMDTSYGETYAWRAPIIINAGSDDQNYPIVAQYIITAKLSEDGESSGYAGVSWVFNIYPPQLNQYIKFSPWNYPANTTTSGYVGSGVTADHFIHPLHVSFAECDFREGWCNPSNVSGYFSDKAHPHLQTPAWLSINSLHKLQDEIGINPPGFYYNPLLRVVIPPGTWNWEIPHKYRLKGTSTYETYLHQTQLFSKDQGTAMTVAKANLSHTRDAGLPPGGGGKGK